MADLLTFYDDDEANTFIECLICDKRIRGETQYKIHLTTLQHVKKEEVLADQGVIPRQDPLPEWTDIKQYLRYLNLDEPIIGLSTLVQEEDIASEDGKTLLKYRCRMCTVEMDMCSMATHLVGRKHRQRYLQLKRPDLVTWHDNTLKQPGLVAKARAAVVEKQEGWGDPVPLNRQTRSRSLNKPAQVHDLDLRDTGSHEMELSDKYRSSTRSSRYDQDDTYDRQYRRDDSYQPSYPEDDQSRSSYSPDRRQRGTYQEERTTGRSYAQEEVDLRYEEDNGGRPYDEPWEKRYPDRNTSRGQFSSRDAGEDFYRDRVEENRFAARDQRVGDAGRRSTETSYQEREGRQDLLYMSSEDRGLSMGEMQRPAKDFWYAEKGRPDRQDPTQTSRSGSYESQGYTQRHRDLEEGPFPGKRKRKSRFSDVTAEEMVLARKCQIETLLRDEWKKMDRVRKQPKVFEKRAEMTVTQSSPNRSNVLEVLNELKIESLDDANFLKEKLCSLLKEFNANKAQQTEQRNNMLMSVRDYSHTSSNTRELLRSLLEARHMNQQGFKESARYEHNPRSPEDYKSRGFHGDYKGPQEAQRFEESSRDFQEARHFEDDYRTLQNVRRHENDTFQESARYKTDPIDFQGQRNFEGHSVGFKHDGRFEDSSRDVELRRHFEENSTDFQQPGSSNEGYRDFRSAGLGQETSSFQSVRHARGREDYQGYEEYERGERSHSIAARESVKGRYPEDDFRHSQSSLEREREYEWSRSRGTSAERSADLKTYYPDVKRRDFRENLWSTTSVRGEERAYPEGHTAGSLPQRNYRSGSELYDPFNPSSPPREMPSNSSLEKLASTLLEIVASKST